MVEEKNLIRVNSWREKRALSFLSLALGVLGMSLDDLKAASELVHENASLRQENAELSKRLDAATGGKPEPEGSGDEILAAMKKPDAMHLTKQEDSK